MAVFALLVLAACGGDGSERSSGSDGGQPSVAANATAVAADGECAAGGVEVETGIDENGNGDLDAEEVDETAVLCNGEDGDGGRHSLLLVDNRVGDNCSAGGVRVRAGLDDNGNGSLDAPDEVDDTAFACGAGVAGLRLEQIGRYESGAFDEGAAEIVAHDPASQRVFVVNANEATVDVLDINDPASPTLVDTISAGNEFDDAGGINSVASAGGIVAIAVENEDGLANGRVQFYNAADLAFRGQVAVGVLPDLVTFTPDGSTALVANEGEPADDYSADPEGSVSIIDAGNPDNPTARTAGFSDFNAGGPRAGELPAAVRVFGNFQPTALTVAAFADSDPATLTVNGASGLAPNDFFTLASTEGDPITYRVGAVSGDTVTLTTDFDGDSEVSDAGADGLTVYLHDGTPVVSRDLEPEYIAVSPDGTRAYVTLQENNAVAEIDIASARVERITALGAKNHSIPGNELDASNDDDRVNIRNWPLRGLYMPDAIAAFESAGQTYYITANEGDAREYDAYVEEVALDDHGIQLDGDSFANPADLAQEAKLGVINMPLSDLEAGDADGDGLPDELYVFGGRSFSIWSADGTRVFDSGSDFAVKTANRYGLRFNNDNAESDPDGRSDNKGTEPEAVSVAEFNGRTYAFIGLERMGGIMVYDLTNPAAPTFVTYTNNRDFGIDIEDEIEDGMLAAGAAGDLGPESIAFIPGADSPNGEALIAVGNEVSGTTTLYRVVGN